MQLGSREGAEPGAPRELVEWLLRVQRAAPGVSQHEQRLLAGFALAVSVCAVLFGALILPQWLNPSAPTRTWTFGCGVFGGLGGVVVFGLNRRGRYRGACHLFLLLLFLAPCLASLDRTAHIAFLCFPILLSTALLEERTAGLFGALALGAHAFPLLHSGVIFADIVVPLSANAVLLLLYSILQSSNRRLEQQRLEALRRGEERLNRAERLESLGRLAGGVAHDFNNLLTVIGGGLELVLGELEPDSPLRADLGDVMLGTERAVALTRQLLAVSRRQVMQPRVLELNAALTHAQPLIRSLLKANVRLELELDGSAGRVLVDPVQLEQVVLNLCLNAADAMPQGGRLTLASDAVQITGSAHTAAVRDGGYVRLRVSDTGHGMSEATLQRAFEPFFTTKELGRGTGLGLATVHGIIEQSGGSVAAESTIGVGTTFTVLLPQTTRALEESLAAPRPVAQAPVDTPTVLLVEDEHAVRKFAARVLASLGYAVIEADSAEEALRLWPARGSEIDLLLTDVVMPGLTGPQLATELRRQRPALPVLFMSGYADEVVARQGVSAEEGLFLEKPYTTAALAALVESALRGAPSGVKMTPSVLRATGRSA